MNSKRAFGLLLTISFFIVLSLGCGRIASNTNQNDLVSINASKDKIEINESVTLNAILNGAISIKEIRWSAEGGTLNVFSGSTVIYTAGEQVGSYTISVAVEDINLAVTTTNFTIEITHPDTIPPGIPVNVSAIPSDNSIDVSWKLNTEEDLAGYKIYYSTTPGKYTDSVDVGLKTSYSLTSLTNGVNYFLAVSAYDNSKNKNESPLSQEFSVTPKDDQAPASPSVFQITPSGNTVILSWINPTDADFQVVNIVKKKGCFPQNILDGELIASGNFTTFTDSNIETGIQYFYSIFALDEIPLYSEPATKTIIVLP